MHVASEIRYGGELRLIGRILIGLFVASLLIVNLVVLRRR
mgnify:CR=1 FL=1